VREAVYNRDGVELYHGDALDVMLELYLAGRRFDAIVTSPPYADLRDYGGAHPSKFAGWLAPFLARMARILDPAGSLMLNLGRVFRDGEETPYHELAMLAALELGWRRIDTLVWRKTNAMPTAGPYLRNVHELVYRLALRPAGEVWHGYDELRTEPAPDTITRARRNGLRGPKDDSGEYDRPRGSRTGYSPLGVKPTSVFDCPVGVTAGIKHTAPMAPDLAMHLVALSTPPGGTVLDPFGGSGTTALAARALGRNAVLIELDADAAGEAEERLSGAYLSPRRRVNTEQLGLEEPAA
jgi:site-specific DNA-methyltransferase (adenine-specific)